ncbi:MAG: hypothetical protein M1836_000065 [Candelina mexicana]|nr:MAG: hypothetical protein M1836_000065 [Candelina mexicana]
MRCLRLSRCGAYNRYNTIEALRSAFVLQWPILASHRFDIHYSVSLHVPKDASAELSRESGQFQSQGASSTLYRLGTKSIRYHKGFGASHDGDIKVNSLKDTLEAHRATNLASRIRKVNATANYQPDFLRIKPQPQLNIKYVDGSVNSGWQHGGIAKRIEPKRRIEMGFPNLNLAPIASSRSDAATASSSDSEARYRSINRSKNHAVGRKTLDYTGRNTLPLSTYSADISQALITASPWLEKDVVKQARSDPFHRLHAEILAFHDLMRLDHNEVSARDCLVQSLEAIVDRLLPGTRLEVFGSTVTGISLPTSDIDLQIIDPDTEKSILERGPSSRRPQSLRFLRRQLETFKNVFTEGKQFHSIIIRHGRVPVVAATHRRSGLDIQISTTNNQLASQEYVKNYLVEFPTIRPLFVVVRRMLQMRGLTEVYEGGLGSYSIFMMIVAFLKLHPPFRTDEFPLGRQLRDFFSFYAEFKVYQHGLSIEPPLKFPKYPVGGKPTLNVKEAIAIDSVLQGRQQISVIDESQPYLLCLQDPANPKNDLGKKAYGIKHIRKTFSIARRSIDECIRIWEDNQSKASSSEDVEYAALEKAGLLWPVVGGNYHSFERHREKIRRYGKEMLEERAQAEKAPRPEDNTSMGEPPSTEADTPIEGWAARSKHMLDLPEFRSQERTPTEIDRDIKEGGYLGEENMPGVGVPEEGLTSEGEVEEARKGQTATAPRSQELSM